MRLVHQPLPKRLGKPGLADARLAREQHHLALAVAGQPPPVQQQSELVLAADERGQAGRPPGLKPARSIVPLAGHPPSPHGLRKAAQGRPAEVDEVEHAAEQAPGAVGDDDRAGLRELLQAGRQVRGLADHRLLTRRHPRRRGRRRPRARSRSRPGPRGRRRPASAAAPTASTDGEPRPDGPLGLVLVGPGPAEVGQHAVAHELRDMTLKAGDLARDGVLVGAQDRVACPRGRAEPRARSSRPGRRTSP